MGALYPWIEHIDPQTPFLQPQTLPDEEDPVPDFYLDDDAGVGSCMDFEPEISTASLGTILALERQYTSPSPTPSLISDTSAASDASVSSQVCKNQPSDGTFKFKKVVRFLDSVDIVPLEADEPRSTVALKPPQEPMKIRKPLGSSEAVREAENIGIMHGLGRAGGSRNLVAQMYKRELEKRVHSPPTDNSDSEDDFTFGDFMLRTRHHRRQKQLRIQHLFPSPAWRSLTDEARTVGPLLKAPSTQQTSRVVAGAYDIAFEDATRYGLQQTSPPPPQRALGTFSIPPPPTFTSPPPLPSPSSPEGARRLESNFTHGYSYNNNTNSITSFSPPPIPPPPGPPTSPPAQAHIYQDYGGPNFQHAPPLKQTRCLWKASDGVYRDRWGREVRISGDKGTSSSYTTFRRHDLWSVDEAGEEAERLKLKAAAMRGLGNSGSGGGGGGGGGVGSRLRERERERERERDQAWKRNMAYAREILRVKR